MIHWINPFVNYLSAIYLKFYINLHICSSLYRSFSCVCDAMHINIRNRRFLYECPVQWNAMPCHANDIHLIKLQFCNSFKSICDVCQQSLLANALREHVCNKVQPYFGIYHVWAVCLRVYHHPNSLLLFNESLIMGIANLVAFYR